MRRLATIKARDVVAYRERRHAGGLGPAYINMEIGCLRRILKKVGLWHLIGDGIKPLREPPTIGRALNLEERTRLFHLAGQKPERETAYLAAVLAVHSTARKCELRGPQWRHIDFINRALEVPKSKTEAGVRVVPLNTESYEALWKLHRRAGAFGPVNPSHFCVRGLPPEIPLSRQEPRRNGVV
jgi:integrase